MYCYIKSFFDRSKHIDIVLKINIRVQSALQHYLGTSGSNRFLCFFQYVFY